MEKIIIQQFGETNLIETSIFSTKVLLEEIQKGKLLVVDLDVNFLQEAQCNFRNVRRTLHRLDEQIKDPNRLVFIAKNGRDEVIGKAGVRFKPKDKTAIL